MSLEAMMKQIRTPYERIAQAIEYLQTHFREQPSLDQAAKAAGLSPFHFQRLFSQWAGVSPKKFLQYLSLEYAKTLLRENRLPLLDAAYETGLSGTSRLHDLFVTIEGMTPGEFKNGGETLRIYYGFSDSPFGTILAASTPKGVCHLAFEHDPARGLKHLKKRFPEARYEERTDRFQRSALSVFQQDWKRLDRVKLHLHATAFQLKVWESLLKIPAGRVTTYGAIAEKIGKPRASRAVGTAIGRNPVAFLIPCHRVIQGSGKTGGYMWGGTRKSMMLGWEASRVKGENGII